MSITQCLTNSFKKELFQALHDFTTSTGHIFKLALYNSNATLNESTTVYTSDNECSSAGYTAGGYTVTMVTPVIVATTAIVDVDDLTVPGVTLTAAGGLIYNSTSSNRSVAVLDFGGNRTNTGADFVVTFPSPDVINGIIRIS